MEQVEGVAASRPNPITPDVVREEARRLVECAKEAIAQNNWSPPIIMVACRVDPTDPTRLLGAEHCLLPVMLHGCDVTPAAREQMLGEARAVAMAGDAVASILCVNAWSLLTGREPEQSIAAHPDRRHALVCVVEWSTGHTEYEVWVYERDQGFVDWDDVSDQCEHTVDVGGDSRVMLHSGDPTPDADTIEAARAISRCVVDDFALWWHRFAQRQARGVVARG